MFDLLIKNGLVFIDNKFQKINIGVLNEHIFYLGDEIKDAKEIYDASGKKIIPGLIDPHVHFAFIMVLRPQFMAE